MVLKRNSVGFLPFVLGLLIGLLISYGIRLISSRTGVCRQSNLYTIVSEPQTSDSSPVVVVRDQILNLAFDDTLKANDGTVDNSDNLKHGIHHLCSAKGNCKTSSVGNSTKKRNLLFVGVMTANLYISSRAKAVWETWAKNIPGKVVFYTGGNIYGKEDQNRKSPIGMDLVPLVGVDDSYPPQKKSFMMLKHMYDHYGDDYEWFMRADDDVYVRSDKLGEFLRSIDSRHLYFIGQAGKGNRVEKGTLNLANNENFCMGGPGIIMSRSTLEKVAPQVQHCLTDMYSTHEDVEVGRCVQRFAKISCTWAFEMQSVFHHNSSGASAFTGKLRKREVHNAITLHPVKNHEHLYRLHSYFQGLKIQDLLYETILIHRDLLTFSEYTQEKNLIGLNQSNKTLDSLNSKSSAKKFTSLRRLHNNSTGLPISLNKFSPKTENEILLWDFIGKWIHSAGAIVPKQKLRGDAKESLEDVVRQLMDIINGYSRVRGRIIDFKEILYGYRRVNPLHGVDYILDILMTYKKYRGKKMTIQVRKHVYIQRPFSPLQIRMVSSANTPSSYLLNNYYKNSKPLLLIPKKENKKDRNSEKRRNKLVMIVPLSGRFTTFQRFLDSFSTACLELYTRNPEVQNNNYTMFDEETVWNTKFDLSLVVVFFGSDVEKEKFLDLVKVKRASLVAQGVSLCKIKMVQIDGDFSRAIALETGISQCNDDELLFLIDVDLTFSATVIHRVYLNTVRGQKVYFPIVFSQYNPSFYYYLKNTSLSSDNLGFDDRPKEDCNNMSERCDLLIRTDIGYWREFGFGICSFYKSDFRIAGGFDTSIKGWGIEDVSLFERFVQKTNLTIFRASDPELIHIFHEIECDPGLPHSQHEMCLGSQANTLGSSDNLMRYIFEHREDKSFKDLLIS